MGDLPSMVYGGLMGFNGGLMVVLWWFNGGLMVV